MKRKGLLLGVLISLLLTSCGGEDVPSLRVNQAMQEDLENRTPGSITWIEDEKSSCVEHQPKRIRTATTHQTVCSRCGETINPVQPHEVYSTKYDGYTIIDGKIYLRCDVKCQCGYRMEQHYLPYEAEEATEAP
ncbi:MAG: hypothetical protein IJW70_04740 [Clostridia bacterium]|nr:hypothetical protein [Clostridia bacterium]